MLNHTARVSPIRAIVAIALALICFSAVAAPVLNYQGRLLEPGTNQPMSPCASGNRHGTWQAIPGRI